jgi:two-component system OmpR family sensor kinase
VSRPLSGASLRTRLLLAVVVAVAAALAILVLAFNLVVDGRLDSDVTSLLRARSADQLATLSTVDGRLTAPEAPDVAAFDSATWIYSGARLLEYPTAPAAVDRAAAVLAGGPRRSLEVGTPHTRLLAVPAVMNGRRLGTVISGVALAPYDRTKRTTLIASLAFAMLLLAAVALAARWGLAAALRPVSRMTDSAADWSEHDLDRRFGLGVPRDELTGLAATLDRLLDRVAEGMRRERRFSAELSHELRTPLARITTEAQLALRAPHGGEDPHALEAILASARQMGRTLEALMAAARAEVGGRAEHGDLVAASRSAIAACSEVAARRGIEVKLVGAEHALIVAGAPDLVERILHPLIDNACRFARSQVTVELGRRGHEVLCTVIDDGPGVDVREREQIFEPGARGAAAGASPEADTGAGLGLALARRLAMAAHGQIEAQEGPGGRFVVALAAV